MKKQVNETPALLIIDMVKDNFIESRNLPVTPFARAAIKPLNKLIAVFRDQKWPIVFSTDAFHEDDFIFKGRMQPHSLSGTEGAKVVDALDMQDDDLWPLCRRRHYHPCLCSGNYPGCSLSQFQIGAA